MTKFYWEHYFKRYASLKELYYSLNYLKDQVKFYIKLRNRFSNNPEDGVATVYMWNSLNWIFKKVRTELIYCAKEIYNRKKEKRNNNLKTKKVAKRKKVQRKKTKPNNKEK